MKITAYHAASGDCVLVTGTDGNHNILVDGGRSTPYKDHIRARLGALRDAGGKIDLLCVSHVDNDHVSGILDLLEDEVAWRKHQFDLTLDPASGPPSVPRPPEIVQVWHNAMFVLVGEDSEHLVDEIATSAAGLFAATEAAHDLVHRLDNIATGYKEGMEISRRMSTHHLNLRLNPQANGGMLKRVAVGSILTLGDMEIFLLGPSQDDIDSLRTAWDTWLNTAGEDVEELHDRLRADEEELGTAFDPEGLAAPQIILDAAGIATALGEGGITPPNLASIMMLVEEGDESLLLTGDGCSEEILQGLEHHGKIAPGGTLHVTTLKVQHHGASANVTEEFCQRITADNYLFCSNGSHHNPEIEVVEAFANARLTGIGDSDPVGPDTDFKFWFTSSPTTPGIKNTTVAKPQMIAVKNTVDDLRAGSGGRMTAKFIKDGEMLVK